MPDSNLKSNLQSAAGAIEAAAAAGPSLTWSEYKAQKPTGGATVTLTEADFNQGTLRITTGNVVFRITSDIIIQPGSAPDFFPVESTEFPFPPYQLGWFAGITVETDQGVVIDLNGYCIKQSGLFALQQRFYAIIELGDQPFLENQGPSQFGPLVPCSNVTIRNGILGTSSHHGIHSPGGATNILLENLQIQNFEVAGIHLNGCKSTVISSCSLGPARRDVPVLGTYSQCRFIRSWVAAIDQTAVLPFLDGAITGAEVLADLDNVLATAYNNVSLGRSVNFRAPECNFLTGSGTPIGSAYGLVLNKKGVAVNGFLMTAPGAADAASNLVVENVTIIDIVSSSLEVVGVSNPVGSDDGSYGGGGGFLVGPVGDVFRIDDLTCPGITTSTPDLSVDPVVIRTTTAKVGVYKSTALSNAQLFVNLRGNPQNKGTANIPTDPASGIMGWALSGDKTFGTQDIAAVLTTPPTNNLYRIYNGDSMAHSLKGNVGLFVQGVQDASFENVDVEKVHQTGIGAKGTTADYPPPNHTSHPTQNLPWYQGSSCRGIVVASSSQIDFSGCSVSDLLSFSSSTTGVDVMGESSDISTTNLTVKRLQGCSRPESLPNLPGVCCPFVARATTSQTTLTSSGKCPVRIFKT